MRQNKSFTFYKFFLITCLISVAKCLTEARKEGFILTNSLGPVFYHGEEGRVGQPHSGGNVWLGHVHMLVDQQAECSSLNPEKPIKPQGPPPVACFYWGGHTPTKFQPLKTAPPAGDQVFRQRKELVRTVHVQAMTK